ncbi:Putative RxLR effector [Phytophthora palmivora]|uniref:RxLR effector protein n=1 Tax=Phytophthora palmivora TaxID=4796 RepID=A0A2P4YMW0_9STRA|nr:Putative RxLR effector [Phytophthora palmivora]
MRLIHTIAVVIAVTLCASSAALPATKGSKVVVEHAASPRIVESITDGDRLLRRVEDSDDDKRTKRELWGAILKAFCRSLIPPRRLTLKR